MSNQSLPIVTICDGVATTLSIDVASFFGKRHDAVIRSIENIISTLPESRLHNFVETEVSRESPVQKGTFIKSKAYRLTRDGFTFLAMGFTGKKAQEFKWAYIDAFNAMENELRGAYALKIANTVTPAQQLLIRQCVADRARNDSKGYRDIYRAIHNRFQIARYDQLPQTELNECLKFIQEVDVICLPRDVLMLTPREAECISQFVYYWRYLFKPELQMILNLLRVVDSPKASRFSEMLTNMNLLLLERLLDEQGFPVYYNKELLED